MSSESADTKTQQVDPATTKAIETVVDPEFGSVQATSLPFGTKERVSANVTLHEAATKGDLEAVKQAVANGAEIDTQAVSESTWTPAQEATWEGHFEVAEWLLEQKADLNKPQTSGIHLHPLSGMIRDGYQIKWMIEHKANVNLQDVNTGNTLLMDCVFGVNLTAMESLIKHGADSRIRNKDGKSALDYAKQKLRDLTPDAIGFTKAKEMVSMLSMRPAPLAPPAPTALCPVPATAKTNCECRT